MFGILVLTGIALLPVLLPVAATDDSVKSTAAKTNGTFSDLDYSYMGNVKVFYTTFNDLDEYFRFFYSLGLRT